MLGTLSELDAINIILSSVGSDPVNSLDEEADVDLSNARFFLEKTSRDIQRKGWDFNTYTYTMYPDTFSKKILWDARILKWGCGQKPGHENTIVKKNEIHQRANHCRADIV